MFTTGDLIYNEEGNVINNPFNICNPKLIRRNKYSETLDFTDESVAKKVKEKIYKEE